MADSPHGLKDLFGSVPDGAGEGARDGGAAPGNPAPMPGGHVAAHGSATHEPRTHDPDAHGLIGALGAARTDPAPAPQGDAPPVLDAPNLAPLPPDLTPQVPAPAPGPSAPPGVTGPALSCVVVARGGAVAARRTIQSLRLQTIADGLDVLVVADAPAAVSASGFARLRTLIAPSGSGYGAMAATGVADATGALVAILDDYAFPARDWAEAIASHRHDAFAALGSALGNANPRSPMSWSNMLLDHGAWRDGVAGGTVDALPARNLVYRRDALEALGDELPALLESGEAARRIAASGLPLKQQDEARIAILNPSGKRVTMRARYAAGRLDAAAEARGLSMPKRVSRAVAAALGGPARYARLKPRIFQGSDPTVNPKLQGRAVMLALTAEGVGRAAGFVRGPGRAAQTRERIRAKRLATLNKVDRKQFAG